MDWKAISNNVLLVGLFVGMVTMFNQIGGRLDTMQAETNRRFDAMQVEVNRRFDAVQAEIGQVRGEIGQVRGEIGQVRGEIGQVRGEIGQVREEMNQMRVEMNRRFDTLQAENQRQHDAMEEVLRVFEGRITRLEEKGGIGPDNVE
ncbi:MAG: hypothetical protein OXP66_15865 [Candidatus Tectomicrobia bacterium]|nr:hypothetical protein [bacterium]MDE0207489.1 hypothetical protein [Candidatus Tectomicrobia bacterium]